jgi:hypothetical protein
MNLIIRHSTGGYAQFYYYPQDNIANRVAILNTIRKYLKKVKRPKFSIHTDEGVKEKEVNLGDVERILTQPVEGTSLQLMNVKYVAPCFNKKYLYSYFSDGMYGNHVLMVSFRPMPNDTPEYVKEEYDKLLGECFPQNVYPSCVGVNNEALFFNPTKDKFFKKCGIREVETSCLPMLSAYLGLREKEAVRATTLQEMRHEIDKNSWSFLKNVNTSHVVILKGETILSIRGTIKAHSTLLCISGFDVPVHIFVGLVKNDHCTG